MVRTHVNFTIHVYAWFIYYPILTAVPHWHAMGDAHVLHPLQRVKNYVPKPMSPSVALTVIRSTTTVYGTAGIVK